VNVIETPPASHIHTPEWQSFEARMRARLEERKAARRRRRARRIGLASLAMVSGLAAFGVTLFLMSADLTPPAIAPAPAPALMTSLASVPLPVIEELPSETGDTDEAATGTAGRSGPVEPTAEPPITQAQVPEPRPSLRSPPTQSAVVPRTEPASVTPPPAAASRSAPPTSEAARSAGAAAPPSEAAAPPSEPTARSSESVARPSEAAARSSETVARPFERAPERVAAERIPEPTRTPDALPSAEPATASGAPAHVAAVNNAAAVAPPVVDPREPVRHTIERYRTAYEQLDAGAARAVWPAVDQGALARAFSSLSSQQLTFEGCTVDVTGATARANCRGRARVVPRVGGGSETARREWRFWLREANGRWVIERAEVR
jgi:hypothetical protein